MLSIINPWTSQQADSLTNGVTGGRRLFFHTEAAAMAAFLQAQTDGQVKVVHIPFMSVEEESLHKDDSYNFLTVPVGSGHLIS
jgi:hypothetical protein